MKVCQYKEGDSTIEAMNNLAEFLLKNNIAHCDDDCGFQEESVALCDFEVHVVKKRYANQNLFQRR